MPRTKAAELSDSTTENIKPNKSKMRRDIINSYLKAVENESIAEKDQLVQNEYKQVMLRLHTELTEECLKLPRSNCKTIAELRVEKPEIETTLLKNITVNSAKSASRIKKYNYTSRIEDTASRFRLQSSIKKAKTSLASKSLAQTKLKQAVKMSSFVTPVHNTTSGTFGQVTPKVKPNTPQVVLRRPRQGEIAISMQGSPLMVSGIISDQKPNVNIPLLDGRVLSIQPQKGLRTSQIPDIDADTKRQIETLRDNLDKVCAFSARR